VVGLVAEMARAGGERALESTVDSRIVAFRSDLLVVARLLVPAQEADDLVQSTLEIALRHASDVREQDRLRAWLMAIEAREAFRLRRRLRLGLVRPFTDDDPQPQEAAADDELIALRAAVHGLPERIRAAVVLHHMARLTVTETAAAMGTTENTVKAQLKTGLQRLREALA
jgi:RNA polymerase sigma factor (sigma-70 family)